MIWKILIHLFLVVSNHDLNLTKSYDLKGLNKSLIDSTKVAVNGVSLPRKSNNHKSSGGPL